MTAPPTRLLLASIGNPGAHAHTLHSAGHIVLTAWASKLNNRDAVPFARDRSYGQGRVARGPVHTYFISDAYMNVSGPAINTAWRAFQRENGFAPQQANNGMVGRLVVIHDELEAPLGSVKVRSGAASPKGHNGLRSIKEACPGVQYTRIGVGIGRPVERDPAVVAAYVLRRCTGPELKTLMGSVVERVEREVEKLAIAAGQEE